MSTSKAQLIDAIAKEADLSNAKEKQAIDLKLWAISEALTKGEDVTLIGFETKWQHDTDDRKRLYHQHCCHE